MTPRKKAPAQPKTAAELAQRILEELQGDPAKMTKLVALGQRQKVIDVCMSVMGEQPPPIRYGRWDSDYARAHKLIAGYEGNNPFIVSLRSSFAQYGSLTIRQAAAVLRPPSEVEQNQLAALGVEGVQFSWQVQEALQEARKRDLTKMHNELAE